MIDHKYNRGKMKKHSWTGNGCKSEGEAGTECKDCIFNNRCEFKEENMASKTQTCENCGRKIYLNHHFEYKCDGCGAIYTLDYVTGELKEVKRAKER